MGKSTISTGPCFNSYVRLPEGTSTWIQLFYNHFDSPMSTRCLPKLQVLTPATPKAKSDAGGARGEGEEVHTENHEKYENQLILHIDGFLAIWFDGLCTEPNLAGQI